MSGGHWDYKDSDLASEIFGYEIDVDYDLSSEKHDKNYEKAIHKNPLKDLEISALVYDLFCLLHSYDWAASGDTDESCYWSDVAQFKKRWLKTSRKAQMMKMIDICADDLKKSLYRTFVDEHLETE